MVSGVGCQQQMQTPQVSVRPYFTECIYELALESRLPHNIISSFFTIPYKNIESTILWGG